MVVFAFGWGLLEVWLGVVVAGAELVILSLALDRAPAEPPAPDPDSA